MSIKALKSKISNLPKTPGVYEFCDKQGKIIYIGKATSLRDRVGSYFSGYRKGVRPQSYEESGRTPAMIAQIADIKIHETDSVLEALILEANLIKKHQPKYNVMLKDDKSFAYAVITEENFPRVLILRETDLRKRSSKLVGVGHLQNIYGPYTSKKQLEIALKLVRKIFPYHSAKQISKNCCFEYQIGLCPGPYVGAITKKDYLKNIHGIEMILQGKKKYLLKVLERQMKEYSRKDEFEKAAEARNRIFALEHIRDISLISEDMVAKGLALAAAKAKPWRIEAYDISNIGGDYATGSMVVFGGRRPDKSQYRKFKIMTVAGIDDVGMMREMLRRRFQNDWPLPDMIFVDGGKSHLNMAENVVSESGHDIPVVGVAKGPTRKKLDMYYNKEAQIFQTVISDERLVERIRSEAHRFAITYHKKLSRKHWKYK
jgi:excinuclease ABC subunit C